MSRAPDPIDIDEDEEIRRAKWEAFYVEELARRKARNGQTPPAQPRKRGDDPELDKEAKRCRGEALARTTRRPEIEEARAEHPGSDRPAADVEDPLDSPMKRLGADLVDRLAAKPRQRS